MILPLRLMLDVAVKSQLAARVRVIPALLTKGYLLCWVCLANNDVSTWVAAVSPAVTGAAKLQQQTPAGVPLQLELLNERLELRELRKVLH